MIVDYIDAHKDQFGVSYYAHRSPPPSARSVSDAASGELIAAVHADNYGAYGARKVHAELHRLGRPLHRGAADAAPRAARHHQSERSAHNRARARA
ncbi:MAG: hypothetical protein WAN48_15760 [Actinomycetes bacterium]